MKEKLPKYPGDDHSQREPALTPLGEPQQLEPEEARGPVDGVGPVGEPLLQLLVGLGGDGDGVDLHDGHVVKAR